MKKNIWVVLGAFVLAIAVGGVLCSYAFAQGGGSGDQERAQDRDQIRDPSTHDGTEPDQDRDRTQDRDRLQDASATATEATMYQNREGWDDEDAGTKQTQNREQARVQKATTTDGLRLMIRERERELEQNASTSDDEVTQERIRNENRVRTAVHALLAAEDLIGPMGQQVRLVAQTMQEEHERASVAEEHAQGRGFWARFFFGGDKENGQIMATVATENRARIQELRTTIADPSISNEVRAELESQLALALAEQERLEERAQEELGGWGLFSWRF